ncbi:hypothetical protein AMTR_s00071p00155560 [Amborella trichopoda]|uniref:BZIP domain-containing protein n=1 Tax=Amborella trichopoda TaxID=13333 RepID=U5D316_AMBTC|nr:hypothetical protein AMTR_s00071p00155560 [Amborella trichopoda]
MANYRGLPHLSNWAYQGRQAHHLPPKSPTPTHSSAPVDFVSHSLIGPHDHPKPMGGYKQHQRTLSESFLIDEQPPWLDDLLNEPDTPIKRGTHRRSSSDSFAYNNFSNVDHMGHEESKKGKLKQVPSWGSLDYDLVNSDSSRRPFVSGAWNPSYQRNVPPFRDGNMPDSSASSCVQQEVVAPSGMERQEPEGSGACDQKGHMEKKDADPKRAKQQFAQRSRVRKLQYIAELERNVNALQVEGSEAASELEFCNQQHLILILENKALKRRLDSLAQEQLLKCCGVSSHSGFE